MTDRHDCPSNAVQLARCARGLLLFGIILRDFPSSAFADEPDLARLLDRLNLRVVAAKAALCELPMPKAGQIAIEKAAKIFNAYLARNKTCGTTREAYAHSRCAALYAAQLFLGDAKNTSPVYTGTRIWQGLIEDSNKLADQISNAFPGIDETGTALYLKIAA